jgi:hypothetical protein
MANDYEKLNAFQKAAKKNRQATATPETREMSPSQKLDRYYGKKAPDGTEGPREDWRPSRPDDRHVAQHSSAFTKTKAPTTYGGVTETPELTAARQAEQARRKALENKVTGQVQSNDYIAENAEAITIGWITRNSTEVGGTFFMSEWNLAQLCKCLDWQIKSGQPGFNIWGISQLTAAHDFLLKGGYYEGERFHRGQAAPKEFPQWVAPQPQQSEPTRTGSGRVYIRRDEMADSEARKLSFDELKQKVQAQFKPESR